MRSDLLDDASMITLPPLVFSFVKPSSDPHDELMVGHLLSLFIHNNSKVHDVESIFNMPQAAA